jgi:hypothetical protein
MALISLGSGITSIRGKIGGTVYQGSASGTIAKNRGFRPRKVSMQSAKAKAILSTLAQYWLTMSVSDRGTWNSYAIFKPTLQNNGTGRFLNGQQIFLFYAYAYFLQFDTVPSAPTFTTANFSSTGFVIQNDSGILNFIVSYNIDETTDFIKFKISNSIPPGRNYPIGGLKYIYTLFANTSIYDFSTAYLDLFGRLPAVGEYVFLEAQLFKSVTANWSNITRLKVQVIA